MAEMDATRNRKADNLTAERAAALYRELNAAVCQDQVCGPEDVRAIRKLEIVDICLIMAALQVARQEALREAVECIKQREQYYEKKEAESEGAMRMTRGLQRNEASGCIDAINRLASEGAVDASQAQ